MKNGKRKHMTRRALSLLLTVLTAVQASLLPAWAAEKGIQTTQTKLVVWDWITDMQSIGTDANYDPDTDPFVAGHAAIPVGDTKYTRIMFYQSTGGDRYYFNGSPDGGNKPGYYSNYDEDKIYLDSDSRIGNSSHREWNQDLADFDHFITVGGQRTPYIQWAEVKQGYQSWRLWAANKDDSVSDYTLMLVDDYEDLDLRRTFGGFSDPHSYYGASNNRIRSDGWIIDTHFVGAAAANYKFSFDNFVIWHWDNDSGQYNETLDFDVGDRRFKAFNAGRNTGVEEFKIYLGKEYSVGTLAENFTVTENQSQTLGRPLYYIPKGKALTVAKDGVLIIDGVLLNDGEINVEDGGLLILKDGAKIMPLTKYDNNCGMIKSKGSIVVGEDALLCGGAVNGIKIEGGGVVNYGVLAAEDFFVSEKYAIENRGKPIEDEGTSFVFAGKSPTREARIRYIMEAIANEGVTRVANIKKDFGKIGSVKSSYNIPQNGIYGDAASNVEMSGEEAVGSPADPTLTVYVKNKPDDQKDETIFEDVKLDRVSLRINGDTATYTADGKEYKIKNKLVSATIGRGGTNKEVLFKDMWVGSLNGAYVQLEPTRATGMRLALSGGGVDGAKAIVWKANDDMDKWWHITEPGTVGVNQTYYLDNYKSKDKARGLDISGLNSVSNGAAVQLYNHDDGGNDQRWILVQSSGTQYFLRNAANQNVSLAVTDGTVQNGTAVKVQTNSSYEMGQYWNFVNLLTEDSYADAVTLGTAMEFIPQSAPGMRMALASGAASGTGVTIRTSDAANNAQRWRLEPVGTDDIDGVATTVYRIAEMTSGLVLSVQGTEIKDGASLVADESLPGYRSRQYWYLVAAGGANKYYVASRGNTGFVVSAPNSQSPASGSALTLKANAKGDYQQWEITGADEAIAAAEEAEEQYPDDPLDGKVFELEPAKMSGYRMVDNDADSMLYYPLYNNTAGTDTAKWKIKRLGSEAVNGKEQPYYLIITANTGHALSQNGEGRVKVDNASESRVYQHWYITENEDGTYTISARGNNSLELGLYTLNGAAYAAAVNGKQSEYTKTTWKLIGEVKSPLDGQTFTIESVAQANRFIVPYGFGTSSSSSYGEALANAGNQSYARWTLKQVGTQDSEPYFQIVSAHNGDLLVWSSGDSYVFTYGSTANTTDSYLWFVRSNDDGTYCIVPKADGKKAMEVKWASNAAYGSTYRMQVSALGSAPTDSQKWKLTAPATDDFLDGRVFYISPKHATDKVLDLSGNGTGNGTNVQLYTKLETEIERWKFEKAGTEYLTGRKMTYYKIINIYADKLLDCNDKYENVQVKIYEEYKNDNSQLWYVDDAGDGYYYIIPRGNTNKCIGANNAGTGDNTAVVLGDKADADSAKWKLTETIVPETFGTFQLESVAKPGFDIDLSDYSNAGSSLVFYETNDDGGSHWKFEKMGTDSHGTYYRIYNNRFTSQVMEIAGSGTVAKDGATALISSWENGTGTDQLWYLRKAGSDDLGDYYYIENYQNSSYHLAVKDDKLERSAAIVLRSTTNDSAKWRLNEQFEPVDLGTYEFGNPSVVDMRITVTNGSTGNDANIILYHSDGTTPERWKIIQRGNDMIDGVNTPYYSIENVNSGKALDLSGAASVNVEQSVQQATYDGYADQHWYMEVRADNTVVFRNRANSKLVLETNGTTDDCRVRLNTYSDSNLNQRWQLHPVMETTASLAASVTGSSVQYYIPGNQAAVDAGIPFATAEDTVLNPAVGGKYTLTPKHSVTLRMNLDGATIKANTNDGSDSQKWQFIPLGVDYFDGDGRIYYKLASGSNANRVVDVAGTGIATAATSFLIVDYGGEYNQHWYLEQAATGDGADDIYYIIGRGTMSKADKICIGVPSGAGSGTQLQTATLRNKTFQQWELEQVD